MHLFGVGGVRTVQVIIKYRIIVETSTKPIFHHFDLLCCVFYGSLYITHERMPHVYIRFRGEPQHQHATSNFLLIRKKRTNQLNLLRNWKKFSYHRNDQTTIE